MECRASREARYERNSDGEWMVHERRESGFQVPRCTVVGGEGVGRCKCWVQAEREQVREQRGVEMMWEWKADLEDEAGREEERQQMGLEMMGMWKVGLESVVVLDEEERGDEVEWRDPDEVAVMAAGPGGFWMAEMEGEVEGVVVEEVEDVAVEAEAEAAGDGWEWEILWGLAAWIIDEDDFA